MSSTRHAQPGADESPERYLSSPRLRGIAVSTAIVARVAHVLPAAERAAMLWLCAYARLREVTADALGTELAMEPKTIRQALTNPEYDRAEFVSQVEKLRARFEAELDRQRPADEPSPFGLLPVFDKALAQIANTSIARKITNAVAFATKSPQIVEIIGRTRIGKSISARHVFLRNLHRAAWLHCPRPDVERSFLEALAESLGVSLGTNYKNSELNPKIEACFGMNRINLLFVDEGHKLWPSDAHSEPRRIEWLRDLHEMKGVAIVILATPQYSAALGEAMADNPRWAPGQWAGRTQAFDLPETMTSADLAAVARHYAPDASAEAVAQLVAHAQASEGFCGAMVAAIERARFRTDGAPLTLEAVTEAQRLLDREARTAQIVPIATATRQGRPPKLRVLGSGAG